MEKTRLKYIDIAKGIGIFLVIWGHLIADGFINNLIYSFHMPMFLFLSGYMLRIKNAALSGAFAKKLVKQLLVPYFVFSAVYLVWEFLVIRESFVGIIYMTYQTVTFRGMAPLWFLASLFFAEFFFLALMKWNKVATTVIMVLLGLLHVVLGRYIDLSNLGGFISNPLLFLVRTSLCAPILACGYGFCHVLQKRTLVENKRFGCFVVSCVMLAVCVYITAVTEIDVNVHLYAFSSIGLFAVTAIAGSIGILTLSIAIKKCRIIESMGQSSLMLMVLHYPITQILKNYIRFDNKVRSVAVSFATAVVLMAVLYLLLKPIQKIFMKRSSMVKQ